MTTRFFQHQEGPAGWRARGSDVYGGWRRRRRGGVAQTSSDATTAIPVFHRGDRLPIPCVSVSFRHLVVAVLLRVDFKGLIKDSI